jgi:hypothetical protein
MNGAARNLRSIYLIGTLLICVCGAAQNKSDSDTRSMTREERIRAHQAKIDKIIDENRKKQAAELEKQKQAAAAAAAANGSAPAASTTAPGAPGAAAAPGSPLPAGPVTKYQPKGPGVPGVKPGQPAAPHAARSEARSLLYFHPYDSSVNLGDTFASDVMVDTKDGSVDTIEFDIKYPPAIVNPLSVDHSAIDSLVKNDIEYYFDDQAGEIHLKFPLDHAQKMIARKVCTIYWEAIEQSEGAKISFDFSKDRTTGLYLNHTNVLGTSPGAQDGVINTTVMIRAPKAKNVVQKTGNSGLIIMSGQYEAPPPSMSLHMETSSKSVRANDEFFVDLVLDNPQQAPLDRLKALIKFNPADLEVVDYDRGNWIRSNVNIYDGFAHDDFRFDFHRGNDVDNERGLIVYDVGSEFEPVRGNGSFARIRFRAKRPVERTEIQLLKTDEASPTTEVSYIHQNMLRNELKNPGVVASAEVAVRNALPVAKSNVPSSRRGHVVGQPQPAGAIVLR